MDSLEVFEPFPKIGRLRRTVIVSEKVDGTNACIAIADDGVTVKAGSRTRWIKPSDDNYGFAYWVESNKEDLLKLGPGRHYGEWFGAGIQRKYGLTEKRFALFNTGRWSNPEARPACCSVVPVLAVHNDIGKAVDEALTILRTEGSRMVPGFMKPEGVVVYHAATGTMFKVLLENDDIPKGAVE